MTSEYLADIVRDQAKKGLEPWYDSEGIIQGWVKIGGQKN